MRRSHEQTHLPALRGWAELSEARVAEGWRSGRFGSWLVWAAVAWLRLCRRFGWGVLARELRSWTRKTV